MYGSCTRDLERWDKIQQQQFIDWGISIKIHGITYLHFTVKPGGRYQMKIIITFVRQFLRASLVRFAFTLRCRCKHNLSYHWNLRRFSFLGPNLWVLMQQKKALETLKGLELPKTSDSNKTTLVATVLCNFSEGEDPGWRWDASGRLPPPACCWNLFANLLTQNQTWSPSNSLRISFPISSKFWRAFFNARV